MIMLRPDGAKPIVLLAPSGLPSPTGDIGCSASDIAVDGAMIGSLRQWWMSSTRVANRQRPSAADLTRNH